MPPFSAYGWNVWEATHELALAMRIYAVVFAAALAVVVVLRRRRPTVLVVALCAAAAMVAATPVPVSWNDGCNDQDGQIALIAAPQVWLAHAADPVGEYYGTSSLVLCLPAPRSS
jgi:hypothetical protein